MYRHFFSAAIVTLFAGASANAAENPALTIYRADSDALFESGASPVTEGYAVVHESRTLKIGDGHQTLVIDGLPVALDAEAVSIDLGAGSRVLAQRVLSTGDGGALAAHRGEKITIGLRAGGLQGTLLGVNDGALIVRDDASGQIVYVREYDTLRFTQGSGLPGSTLQLVADGKAGDVSAALTYPTSGLGWRAAYSARMLEGATCRMRLDALASIANRSGRDYGASTLKLVAGSPNIARQGVPRVFAGKAMMSAAPAPEAMPEQSSLGDYRSYAIDGTLDLPDASVTQVPLYASRDLDCQRLWIFENGGAWFPPKPMIGPGDVPTGASGPIQSQIRFQSTENLPAGNLRVLTRDRDGHIEFLGEARMADTQKGRAVTVALGNPFDLSANRERTAFSIDKAAHEMNEGFRVTLTNSGETARTITVREHPNRWRAWSLLSSSQKPSKQTPETLEFEVAAPANGKATLDYAVKYAWTPKDE
ncbi:MAG TPA: DUF4139 domain-containing protein [Rhodanobacteraceae bacterium]|jgi:hypothetical protein|nr:DUF4139 domain-containing protein [Rhodanobacteraceae bacterium]